MIRIETAEVPFVVESAGVKVYGIVYTEKNGTPYIHIYSGRSEGIEIPKDAILQLAAAITQSEKRSFIN